jgi:hypothetical protein
MKRDMGGGYSLLFSSGKADFSAGRKEGVWA